MQKSGAVLDAGSGTPGCRREHASSRAAADARIRGMHKRGHQPRGVGSERRIHAFAQARRLARSDQKQKAGARRPPHNPAAADADRRERTWAI
jgi:hypothetical protein